jgi:hypothetical protein
VANSMDKRQARRSMGCATRWRFEKGLFPTDF